MSQSQVIGVIKEKCENCFRCISACPVKFCNDCSGEAVEINHNLCIGCGNCIAVCSHNARTPLDDMFTFLEEVHKKRFIVLVAPSVVSVFPGNYLRLNGYLKSLGADALFDVSFGAEITVNSYVNYIKDAKPKTLITQPCPSVVSYIETYKPELLRYLAPVDSPVIHTIKMIKEYYREYRDHRIVFLSPCVAKRRELDDVCPDALNVTFSSLKKHIQLTEVNLHMFDEVEYRNPAPERAVLFSSPGGLKRTVEREIPELSASIRKIEGTHAVYDYFDKLPESIQRGFSPLVVDCLNCEKGCNGGPGTGNVHKSIDEIEYYIEQRAQKAISAEKRKVSKNARVYWQENLYTRRYKDRSSLLPDLSPSQEVVKDAYEQMDKFSREDEFNCSACGYNSCHAMAVAMSIGHNKPVNCYHYLISLLQKAEKRRSFISEKLTNEVIKSGELTEKVSSRLEELKSITSSQVTAIAQSSAAVEEMISSVSSLSRVSDSKRIVLDRLLVNIKKGTEGINEMARSIRDIESSVESVNDLNQIIEDVAERTNLLSMNAAIEAARAGVAGKGFAVVSGEIKKLADQSQSNASEIKDTLNTILNRVDASSKLSLQNRSASERMAENIQGVSDSFNEIISGMAEMSVGGDEVNEALDIMVGSSRNIENFYGDVSGLIDEMVSMVASMGALMEELVEASSFTRVLA